MSLAFVIRSLSQNKSVNVNPEIIKKECQYENMCALLYVNRLLDYDEENKSQNTKLKDIKEHIYSSTDTFYQFPMMD
jgi:hypothetical protein